MKRKTKLAAAFAAAAVMTAGASLTAFAAGWEQVGDEWIFTDNSGNRVTDTWRQSGNYYFYLDSNGIMATDRWVDDTYYVNEDGVRLSNQWIYSGEGTYDAPNSDGGWFYLDANGRTVTEGWRTINGQRYYFDSDGAMQYGWLELDDNLYYLGEENDGSMKTGWLALDMDDEDTPEDGEVASVVSSGEMGKWFYFQENGRMVRASDGNRYANRRINGYRYYFDENGMMATGWTEVAEREDGDPTGISTLKYFGGSDEGQMAIGWRYLIDSPEDDDDEDFSFSIATSSNAQYRDNDGDGGWYYFTGSGSNRGAGYTGERNGYLYYNGKLVEAEDGEDIQVFEVDGRLYLVNETGRVQDSNRAYRVDGEYRYEYDNGTIYYINDDRERIGEVTRGDRLPEIAYRDIYSL